MFEPDPVPVTVARGDLGRMRELRELLTRAGIACELRSPPPAARRG